MTTPNQTRILRAIKERPGTPPVGSRSLGHLVKAGYVTQERRDGRFHYEVTPLGRWLLRAPLRRALAQALDRTQVQALQLRASGGTGPMTAQTRGFLMRRGLLTDADTVTVKGRSVLRDLEVRP